jgi:hypothetical protein
MFVVADKAGPGAPTPKPRPINKHRYYIKKHTKNQKLRRSTNMNQSATIPAPLPPDISNLDFYRKYEKKCSKGECFEAFQKLEQQAEGYDRADKAWINLYAQYEQDANPDETQSGEFEKTASFVQYLNRRAGFNFGFSLGFFKGVMSVFKIMGLDQPKIQEVLNLAVTTD